MLYYEENVVRSAVFVRSPRQTLGVFSGNDVWIRGAGVLRPFFSVRAQLGRCRSLFPIGL